MLQKSEWPITRISPHRHLAACYSRGPFAKVMVDACDRWGLVLVESWQTLEQEALQLAAFGKARLDGKVAYLATIQENGWPRVHPVTPMIGEGKCFVFAEPDSSKVRDLRANGRYALHCGMTDSSGISGEFKMVGTAVEVTDEATRALAESVCSFRPSVSYLLFELQLTEVASTSYRGGRPERRRWAAAQSAKAV